MTDTAPSRPTTVADLARQMTAELAQLEVELGEVDLLISQAKTEASRHETRRAATAEKVATAQHAATAAAGGETPAGSELNTQLVTLTKRAALMESQVEVLEGKRRALARYRDGLAIYHAAMSGLGDAGLPTRPATPTRSAPAVKASTEPAATPAVSRLLLGAQEDLRREIARAMHDGPAQSLTNIVLQAQIVERLVERDPSKAGTEVRQLVAMVQQTLEATKSFIFDVRPMVLDDLGLAPTLRRAARERSRGTGVTVELESLGAERRMPMDLESGLFRMIDEATAAYLNVRAERIAIRLDWGDQIDVRVSASRTPAETSPDLAADTSTAADLPPALAAMMEQRRADARDAVEAARRDAVVVLPPSTWREIGQRAVTLGMTAELSPAGDEVHLVADLPPTEEPTGTAGD